MLQDCTFEVAYHIINHLTILLIVGERLQIGVYPLLVAVSANQHYVYVLRVSLGLLTRASSRGSLNVYRGLGGYVTAWSPCNLNLTITRSRSWVDGRPVSGGRWFFASEIWATACGAQALNELASCITRWVAMADMASVRATCSW
jgi:hypothetical protein